MELAKLTWLRQQVSYYGGYNNTHLPALILLQEPFDSLHENCLRALRVSGGDNQVAALDKCLRTFDLDKLLEALFEFVETYVKYSPDNELEWP